MGRYYNGDIDGKFWFGIQSSTAADRFGVSYSEPNYVQYNFWEDDLEEVEQELDKIKETLGEWLSKFDKFFEENETFNEEKLKTAGFPTIMEKSTFGDYEVARCPLLKDYADYGLGIKIRDCIIEHKSCSFEAEL